MSENESYNINVVVGAIDPIEFNMGSGDFDFGLALSASKSRDKYLQDPPSEREVGTVALVIFTEDLGILELLSPEDSELYDIRESEDETLLIALAGEGLQEVLPSLSSLIKGYSSRLGGVLTQILDTHKGVILAQHIISSSGWVQFGIYPFDQAYTPMVLDSSEDLISPEDILKVFIES